MPHYHTDRSLPGVEATVSHVVILDLVALLERQGVDPTPDSLERAASVVRLCAAGLGARLRAHDSFRAAYEAAAGRGPAAGPVEADGFETMYPPSPRLRRAGPSEARSAEDG
jgi:hypothetical protein